MRIGIAYDLKNDSIAGFDEAQEEYDSPETIDALSDVLCELGHEVQLLGNGRELLALLLVDPPDLVFNLAEGTGVSRSREARVPAVLEMLGIPYTGSDPLTLSVTLDKDCAKRLARSAGVAVPNSVLLPASVDPSVLFQTEAIEFPVVVKPAWEGSSKGIHDNCLVDDLPGLIEAVHSIRAHQHQPILLEEFIDGEEFTLGVIGNHPPQIIGAMRIGPQNEGERFIYSLEAKRNYKQRVQYECPAQLDTAERSTLEQAALKTYETLCCQDVARLDFRMRDGVPYFLEANPLPGFSPVTGDLVILARAYGWSHRDLIDAIVDSALRRNQLGLQSGRALSRTAIKRTG